MGGEGVNVPTGRGRVGSTQPSRHHRRYGDGDDYILTKTLPFSRK